LLVDWFTILAQIINLLILIALLRYFLYGRIIRAMDEREAKIASRWDDAESSRRESEEEAESYRRESRELEESREKRLAEAREEAKELREKLVDQTKKEVEDLRRDWRRSVADQKDSFLAELRRQAGKGVCGVARRALSDIADADLEDGAVRVFVRKIDQLDPDARAEIGGSDGGPAVVRTAFEISDESRSRITETLGRHFDDLDVEFETGPELVCGVELTRGGHRVAWEIGDYLDALEETIASTLDDERREG
jgi:F-type H+-transporting ATPase subunit b